MTEHTPGPWTTTQDGQGHWLISGPEAPDSTTEARYDWLASVTQRVGGEIRHLKGKVRPINRDEAQANARLIAAAPELLEALEAAETFLNDGALLDIVHEVIKNAKGA